MSGAISIHDMQNFAEEIPDIQVSSDIGNVINLGGPAEVDADDLGFGLLSNTNVTVNRPAPNSGILEVPASKVSASDINIGPIETLEAVSFDIPSADGPAPSIHINKESSSFGASSSSSSYFENAQSATGPGIHLASPQRMDPEEERKQRLILLTNLVG